MKGGVGVGFRQVFNGRVGVGWDLVRVGTVMAGRSGIYILICLTFIRIY